MTDKETFRPSLPIPESGPKIKCFGPFRLDAADHSLWRGQERLSIAPKSFDVLRYLVENAGRLVSQNELLEALWRGTFVNPEVLRKYILEIRRVLGDRAGQPLYIETQTKRGYRFVAPITEDDASASPLESPGSDRKAMRRAKLSRRSWKIFRALSCA